MTNGNEAIVLKSGDIFFLSEVGGEVPLDQKHALGLFYHDCRFLNGYTLRIDGEKLTLDSSSIADGRAATVRLANSAVAINWSRQVSSEQLALIDLITLQNLTRQSIDFSLTIRFHSEFEDLFTLRGMAQAKRGRLHPPTWKNGDLCFFYEGADQIDRALRVNSSLRRSQSANCRSQINAAHFEMELAPGESRQLRISLFVSESSHQGTSRPQGSPSSHPQSEPNTQIRSDNECFNRIMARSLGDLDMLRCGSGRDSYFAAGIPWYVALFGRDSIITALQMLAFDSQIAEQTIRLLAHYQGKEVNEWRDEEPGKILHELRVGEMANLNEIPHTPYYGTIDATPLWLILIGRHAAWTGDLHVFNDLRPNIEAALDWIARYGDFDGDGYVEYQCKSAGGLANQGWKDSADGIVNADGSLGVPPVALVEVQGYVYSAKIEIARLYRRTGDEHRASELENEAQRLRERFNRDFWLADGYFAIALQSSKRPAAVLSSNAGHALWSGIAETDHARQTASHLLSPEMFTGWGIRTLSATASRYDPLGYHLGTVWPHDNSLIAAGFKQYGFDDAALRIFTAMVESAAQFENDRLPELFGGLPRETGRTPVAYPIACSPQAWAAGTIPYLLTIILGLEPDAFQRQLRIVRPVLPNDIDRVEFKKLRVGSAQVDLLFERRGGVVTANIQELAGELAIVIES